MKGKKSIRKFNKIWLDNEKYKLWHAKGTNDNSAKCMLYSREMDLSTTGHCALDSYARGKRHCELVKDRTAVNFVHW